MKNTTSLLLMIYIIFGLPSQAYASKVKSLTNNVQTINNKIEARVFAYKKTKHYTAVEIGFTNLSNKYVEFTPKEIYLDDAKRYSQPLLTLNQVKSIQNKKPGLSLIPVALGLGLGIASLATSRGNSDAAFGLAMGALAMGGTAMLTKGFENRTKKNKLITFENNMISDIKRIPPGMTLGGVLYFAPTKKPVSVTIIAKSKSGKYEKRVFYLKKSKQKQKRKYSK